MSLINPQNGLELLKMDSETRKKLKSEIEVYLAKFPNAQIRDVRKFLKSDGTTSQLWRNLNKSTRNSFLDYNVKKFLATGSSVKHRGGNGRKKTPRRTQATIKRLAMNKNNRSLRKVAGLTGVSYVTVRNVLKGSGAKAYHKYRVQKMTDDHKAKRVEFCEHLLTSYGANPRPGTRWYRLINTDFSAKIRCHPTRNSKNDVVWSRSRDEAGDMLETAKEKYSAGDMIWGGVSARGLVPSESPIFVSELFLEYQHPRPKSINGIMYADMVREKAGPAVLQLYPEGNAIWQDDGARIHRCPEVLEAVAATFRYRVDPVLQAPKMADFWPIENVWSIIKQKIFLKRTETLPQLKRAIIQAWREVDADKELCKRLIKSVHKRAAAIIAKEGAQVNKADYD